MSQSTTYPQLTCYIHHQGEHIILSQGDREFQVPVAMAAGEQQSGEGLSQLFRMMDGTHSLSDLQQTFQLGHQLESLVQSLDEKGLLHCVSGQQPACPSLYTPKSISDLAQTLLLKKCQNEHQTARLWSLIETPKESAPMEVIYGFALELYHLFFHQQNFQSASVASHSSAELRHLMATVYQLEYGHVQHIAKALLAIDIGETDLAEALPLPSTMALCNALAFWANFDPHFYSLIVGAWKVRLYGDIERYVAACGAHLLSTRFLSTHFPSTHFPSTHFVEAIEQLHSPELQQASNRLMAYSFTDAAPLDFETHQRLRGQTHLWADILNGFYPAIVNYYAGRESLLRRVSVI